MRISCPEEIAFRLGYIDKTQLQHLAKQMNNNEYGQYLMRLAKHPSEHVFQ
jgi:glucose-1-phosphate thymidylyltransferase